MVSAAMNPTVTIATSFDTAPIEALSTTWLAANTAMTAPMRLSLSVEPGGDQESKDGGVGGDEMHGSRPHDASWFMAVLSTVTASVVGVAASTVAAAAAAALPGRAADRCQ